MKFKGNILEDIDMIYLYEFCRFWYILHINHHSIKNCIHYIIVSFNSWSALLTKIFKFGIKVNCFCFFCFTVREKFLMSDSYYDIDMTFFFHCHEMVLKRPEIVDLSIILSNFWMFWNSFCSKVTRGVGVEPVLTRKLASLPQNLLCHNPSRETKNFWTVENIL